MGFWRPSAGPTARRPFLGAWLFGLALAVVLVAATVHAQDAAETAADLTSLTLEQAIGIGLSAGEEPQIAREEINRADAVVTEHYSAVFPHLTGISGYTYNIERPVQKVDFSGFNPLLAELNLPPMEPQEIPLVYRHEWEFGLHATQNLVTFGRIGKALDLAKQSREASRESATLTDQDTAVRIAEAYYGVVLAKELAQIAHQNKQLADLHLNDALAHFKAGLRSDFDVMQNRAEVSSAEANVIELESREEIAKKALLSAMGQPLDRDVEVAENFREEVVEGDADELVATGVSRRRELVLLNLQSGMSRTAAGLYTANMLPTIDARMDYTWSGVSQTEEDRVWPVEDDWRNFWSVGVGLTWPIFDGFENWGKRRQALAQERISKLRLAQSERTIALEIEQLTKRRDALMKQLTARKDAVDLAQRAFELASLRYDSGLGTLIERADAKAVWTRARVALLQTLYDLNLARVHLRRALGE